MASYPETKVKLTQQPCWEARSGATTTSVVIIDVAVANYESLLAGVDVEKYRVYLLNSDRDGIEQITEILNKSCHLDSLHLVSHGSPGEVQLGSTRLCADSIEAYCQSLQQWGKALSDEADILIYGCQVAADGINRGGGDRLLLSESFSACESPFIQRLSQLTGAKIAASTTLTGSAVLGGDWSLNYTTGQISSPLAFHPEALQGYQAVLAMFTVNDRGDDRDLDPGDGVALTARGVTTLRAAIQEANALAGADEIRFNIDAVGSLQAIAPQTALPKVTESVAIDGWSQNNGVPPATPLIELYGGDGFGNDGLSIAASDVTVRGLAINGWQRHGIYVEGGRNHWIYGNAIGTNTTGTAAIANQGNGITIEEGGENRIGTNGDGIDDAAEGNLISGNTINGVFIGDNAANNTVAGNRIGTNATGTAAIANGGSGIEIATLSAFNRIGTDRNGTADAIEGNLISGNTLNGIFTVGNANNNSIAGNRIGTDITGTGAIANGSHGIQISNANQNTIGGIDPGSGNAIAHNGGDGVFIASGTGNGIHGNTIFNNTELGIDLGTDGVTTNDNNDADEGANTLQNFPILTFLTNTTAIGTLNTTPNRNFRLDFFANTTIDPTENGEGEVYLGSQNVTTDANGNTPFNFNYTPVAGKPFITSTATDLTTNETSEFSRTPPSILEFTAAAYSNLEGNSGMPNAIAARIKRIGGNIGAVSVPIELSDLPGTATADNDYTNRFPVIVTFGDRDMTEKSVEIPIAGDTTFEPDETINLQLGIPTGGAIRGTQTTASYTIFNDDTQPTVSITPATLTQNEGNSGTTAYTFTVTLSNPSYQAIAVNYTTNDGTATAGIEYRDNDGILTFNPGETLKTITVEGVGDILAEPNETFTVRLESATNAAIDPTASESPATIINDDTLPTLAIDDVTLTEGDTGSTNAAFTLSLSAASGQIVTVDYTTADDTAQAGSDYNPIAATTVTFNPGETEKTITVAVNGDRVAEPDETLFVNLTDATNSTIADPQGIATIANDDTPGVSILESENSTQVTEGGANDSYAIALTSEPTAPVTIAFNAGSVIQAIPSITFDNTNWNIPQTVTVSAFKSSFLIVANTIVHTATSTDPNYNGIEIASVSVNIENQDFPEFSSPPSDPLLPTIDRPTPEPENPHSDRDFDCICPPLPDPPILTFPPGTQPQAIADFARGTNAADFLQGYAGNDIIYGNEGNDIILGGSASKNPIGDRDERDVLFGNGGNDAIAGNDGNDTIYAGKDDDLAYGGKEDDLIYGDRGNDTLMGDLGNNTLFGGVSDPTVGDEDGRDLVLGGPGDDFLNGNENNDTLSGGEGNDTLRGGKNDDILSGSEGNDVLFGDRGNDSLCGDDGDDTLDAGTGSDRAIGAESDRDYLCGGNGNDLLRGNSGEDTLNGGTGNDTLDGGDGDDVMGGSVGDDWLTGGSGSDRFVLQLGQGTDIITDFEEGIDAIALADGLTFDRLSVTPENNSTVIRWGDEGSIVLLGVAATAISAADFFTLD